MVHPRILSRSLALFLAAAGPFAVAALDSSTVHNNNNNDKRTCDLECPRNAPCRFGHADFTGRVETGTLFAETHRDGMHCDCPVGWTGVTCDKKFETCSNQNGHECYNGGECILGLQDKYGNDQLFCDCSKSDGYVGKFCETPKERECGDSFCVNGADCNPNYPSSSAQPCICDAGYEGSHCQFETGTVPDCNLDCQNEGQCILGKLPSDKVWSQVKAEDYMSCKCPDGFGGPLCEVPAEKCGVGDGHFCLNGGTCVTTGVANEDGTVKSQHHCDCTTATNGDNDRFAGKYCEHKATSVCSDDNWDLFCTQGGSCKENPIEGCSCQAGTIGYKCEFTDDESHSNTGSNQNKDDNSGNDKNKDDTGSSHQGGNDKNGGNHNEEHHSDHNNGHNNDHNNNHNQGDHSPPHHHKPSTLCAGGRCLNGGRCVEKHHTVEGEKITAEECDCSEAFDASAFYIGPYCQYRSTSLCFAENPQTKEVEQTVCVHQGKCKEDGTCDCRSGWAGDSCEVKSLEMPPKDTSGTTIGEPKIEFCGDTYCKNGGKCVTLEKKLADGTEMVAEHCDCSTAFDEHHIYAGSTCEFASTTICSSHKDQVGLQDSTFCTNHGTCMDDIRLGCNCPSGFFGFSCEYEAHEHESTDKDEDDDDDEDTTDDDKLDDSDQKVDWEICGYGICHNGGKCITTEIIDKITGNLETTYKCDCSTAYKGNVAFLGSYCEYPSTEICTPAESGKPASSAEFCVNHGKCKEDPSEGCYCLEGFIGKSCEFKQSLKDIVNTGNGGEEALEICGDHVCQNGGKCIKRLLPDHHGGNLEAEHCDCSTATDGVHFFAGASCEFKSTSSCPNSVVSPFCVNGGTCQEMGSCNCDSAWLGIHCEYPVDPTDLHITSGALEVGSKEEITWDICGHAVCHNGGKCIMTEIIDKITGNLETTYKCDCSTAYKDDVAFLGSYCEYPSTEVCTPAESGKPASSAEFCVNHGTCKEDPSEGCNCLEGFIGKSCEFKQSLKGIVNTGNGGEEPLEICGNLVCQNGGKCITKDLPDGHGGTLKAEHCDCSSATDGVHSFAGASCEYKSTSICPDSKTAPFCVNGGTCQEDDICQCDSPWLGNHCEYPVDPADLKLESDSKEEITWDVCGHAICHNGGKCITTEIIDKESGMSETTYKCDCSTAHKDDVAFLGSYCEYPSTEVCTPAESGKPASSAEFCVNHGTCKEDPSEGCNCLEGFIGKSCEFKQSLKDIVNTGKNGEESLEICGNLVCQNGGKCITKDLPDGHGGFLEAGHCDCSTATDGVHSFAGSQCEYKSTSICPDSKTAPFCVNGGTCQEHDACKCDSPWLGIHCEYPLGPSDLLKKNDDGSDDDLVVCDLECKNGGVCAQGAKVHGSLHEVVGDVSHLNQTHATGEFAHCVCPEGFIGLFCDHKVETCGEDEHVCLHGSKCIPDASTDRGYTCDCSFADAKVGKDDEFHFFAGEFCEYTDTDICTKEDNLEPLHFCVNGGKCQSMAGAGDPDPGCDCPANYTGPHCEVNTELVKSLSHKKKHHHHHRLLKPIVTIIFSVLGASIFFGGAIYWFVVRRKWNKSEPSDDVADFRNREAPTPPRRGRKAGFAGVWSNQGFGDVQNISQSNLDRLSPGALGDGDIKPYSDERPDPVDLVVDYIDDDELNSGEIGRPNIV